MNGSHGPESHDDRRDAATGDAYQPTCPTCGGDLSQLPADIRSCPYCGQTISAHKPEAEPTKVTEPQRGTGKKRKYSKITAMAGAGILATSIILGLPPPFPITGILITVVSAVIFIRVKETMQAETTQVPPRVGKENSARGASGALTPQTEAEKIHEDHRRVRPAGRGGITHHRHEPAHERLIERRPRRPLHHDRLGIGPYI